MVPIAMTILVDRALWPHRGERWAHLVSDQSHEELHAFAARLGLRPEWFQGDHYDVPARVRDRAVALGATEVEARELVVRLRRAGLRRPRPDRTPAFGPAVAEVLRRLAPGTVVTYGEVALEAGFPGAARAVGTFLRDSEGLPWWRVVRADGRLASGKPTDQARRLTSEGVEVHDGRVVRH